MYWPGDRETLPLEDSLLPDKSFSLSELFKGDFILTGPKSNIASFQISALHLVAT